MEPIENEASRPAATPERRILVWDLPTRLFHWLLVMLVIVSFITGQLGGTWMQCHLWSGFTILGLLLFRLVWGLLGGHHARFSSFVRGPGAVLRYARTLSDRAAPRHLGHNPLGGWSVLAMLLLLMVQVVTGLFANDDIFTEGPLYPWVGKAASDWLTKIHKLNQSALLVLIFVHVAAVLFYLIVKRENLIGPMITGRKYWRGEGPASAGHLWAAVFTAGLTAVAVWLLVR
jgi:cytochrome b